MSIGLGARSMTSTEAGIRFRDGFELLVWYFWSDFGVTQRKGSSERMRASLIEPQRPTPLYGCLLGRGRGL